MTIRVLVVEDSLTVRQHLVELIRGQADMELVGEAGDGRTAIELCARVRPDVITMDMMLPVMTGLAATEYIMAYHPTPILIVSSSTNRGEIFKTYEALAAGALDVFEKPTAAGASARWDGEFIAAVRLASRVRVVTHPRAKLARIRPVASVVAPTKARIRPARVVAIGASTGGPAAVASLLTTLDSRFPLPILLVIHIAESFGHAMAEWLDSLGPLSVRFPRHGEPLPARGKGVVFLAPPGQHMRLVDEHLVLDEGPERHGCRPSVDVLFESLAVDTRDRTIAALLTGMGRDGAVGLRAIRDNGGLTIAQDEASSVIYGMPREAARLGAAAHVLPLPEIAPALARAAAGREGEHE